MGQRTRLGQGRPVCRRSSIMRTCGGGGIAIIWRTAAKGPRPSRLPRWRIPSSRHKRRLPRRIVLRHMCPGDVLSFIGKLARPVAAAAPVGYTRQWQQIWKVGLSRFDWYSWHWCGFWIWTTQSDQAIVRFSTLSLLSCAHLTESQTF